MLNPFTLVVTSNLLTIHCAITTSMERAGYII